MSFLSRIFGLSRKNRRGLLTLFILGMLYAYFVWYPSIVRYKDFGILIPSGYKVHGIDVSRYQGDIIWNEVENMRSANMKISFAIIKATESGGYVDPKFKRNWRNIKRTQLKRGAYHFFRANVDPLKQANHFLKTVKPKSGDLVPVLDVETQDGVSDTELKKAVLKYLRYVENRLGVKPILYLNIDYQKRFFSSSDFLEFPIWIAHYSGTSAPRTSHDWVIWQHSESGRVNSIKSKVDFNVLNGGQTKLEDLTIP